MKLLNLTLKYFRQHVGSEIAFPDGLVGIVGRNGAGKTSLVEAVAFALYGSKAIRGKVEHLRTRGAAANAEPAAVLVFEHEGTGYRVERTTEKARLFRGGEPEPAAEGARDVSARVAQILGMNHEEFVSTYFTEQKGLEFLSGKKGAAERERFIVRMMGYDRLEEVQEALRADRRDKKNELIGWEASLGNRADIEARLEKEAAALESLTESYAGAAAALERAERETAALRTAVEKLEVIRAPWLKTREAIKALEIRLGERERRCEHLEREKARIAAALGGEAPLAEVRGRLNGREAAAIALREGQAALAALQSALQEAELQRRERIARAKGDLDGTARQLQAVLAAQKKAGALQPGSRCPTCAQELGEHFAAVQEHHRREIAAREAEAQQAAAALEEAEREPVELCRLRAEGERAAAAAAELQRSVEELVQLERSLESATRLEGELAEGVKDAAEIRRERDALTRELATSPFAEEAYTAEKAKYDAAARLLEVARLQKVRAEGDLGTHRALRGRTESELRSFDERAAALVERRQLLALLDDGDQALTDFRKHLNASIRPRLAELASEFLAELTDGRYTTVDIGVDFSPTVIEDGEPKPIISGGEEDILNLCLRLALSNMLAERAGQSFSLLMLDEVFGSLDEGRRINVLGLLEKLHQRFEQILVITHLDDIKEGVQSLIEIDYDDATGAVRVGDGSIAADGRLVV